MTTLIRIQKALLRPSRRQRYPPRRRRPILLPSLTSSSCRCRRDISTDTQTINTCQTNFIFGANTDVGKTVLTAGLIRAATSATTTKTINHYVKPLQCGGSDQRFVTKHAPNLTTATTLYEWDTPTSPHIASRMENNPVSDEQVCESLQACLLDLSASSSASGEKTTIWVETAGGVLSPSSSSPDNRSIHHARSYDDSDNSSSSWGWITQGDLYQPFTKSNSTFGGGGGISTILIGDGRLGGISATLSSLESLIIRGYDVAGIILLETGYSNQKAIQEYASRQLKLRAGDGTPLFNNPQASIISLPQLPPEPEPLTEWYESQQVTDTLGSFVQDHLQKVWEDRMIRMKEKAEYNTNKEAEGDGHQNNNIDGGRDTTTMSLAISAAYSFYGGGSSGSSKYTATYPTNQLTLQLLEKNKWADRVIFCRDGESALRQAVNMGMGQFQSDQLQPNSSSYDVAVLCSNHRSPNDMKLGCTTVQFKAAALRFFCSVDGTTTSWSLSSDSEKDISFQTKDEAFDVKSRRSKDDNTFLQYQINIAREWDAIERLCRIASVIIVSPPEVEGDKEETTEIIDPLWQHALWTVATSRNVPVIFDGRQSVGFRDAIGLDCDPDFVVAELDGVGPLGAVIASEWIKNDGTARDGHPFTPTPVECVSAIHAMEG